MSNKIILKIYNDEKNNLKFFSNLKINDKHFKYLFTYFLNHNIKKINYPLILKNNEIIYVNEHKTFYENYMNIEYNSNIFKNNPSIKDFVNLEYVPKLNELYFYDYYRNKKNVNILETLSILLDCNLYETFLKKENKKRSPCIPGIITSKLIYKPYENNNIR